MPGDAGAFIGLLVSNKLIYVVKGIEVVCSLALLSGMYIPLAITLLGPVIFNIFWFHLTLAPEGLALAIPLVIMEGFLIWSQKSVFSPLLKKKVK